MVHNNDFISFDSETYEGYRNETGQLLGQQQSAALPDQELFQYHGTSSYHQMPYNPDAMTQGHVQASDSFSQPQSPDPSNMMRSMQAQRSGCATALLPNIPADMPHGSLTPFKGVNRPMGGQAGGPYVALDRPSGPVVSSLNELFEGHMGYATAPGSTAFPVQHSYGPIRGDIPSARERASQIPQSQFHPDIHFDTKQLHLPRTDEVLPQTASIQDYSGMAERPIDGAQAGEPLIDQTNHPHSTRQYEPGPHQHPLANTQDMIQSTRNPSNVRETLYTDEQNDTTRGGSLSNFDDMPDSTLGSEATCSRLQPTSVPSPLQGSFQQRVTPTMDQPQMTASEINNRNNAGIPSTSGSGQSAPFGGGTFSASHSTNLVPPESSNATIATNRPQTCNKGQCRLSLKTLTVHRKTCDGEFRLQLNGRIHCRFQTTKNCPFWVSMGQGMKGLRKHELNCKDSVVGDDGVKVFRCRYCSREFCHSNAKNAHESTHCAERPK